MARVRKVNVPLLMKNEKPVNTLEELRENFDLELAIGYFKDGRLKNWLERHFYEDEAEQIGNMGDCDTAALCAIIGVDYDGSDMSAEEIEKVAERQERRQKLAEFTSETWLLDKVDQAAFDQDELEYLLQDVGEDEVLLVNGTYRLPLKLKNKKYIGVGNVTVEVKKTELVDFEALGIELVNISFDEAYQKLVSANEQKSEQNNLAWDAVDWEKYPFPQYKRVAANWDTTIILDDEGKVRVWGKNRSMKEMLPDIPEPCVSVGLWVLPGRVGSDIFARSRMVTIRDAFPVMLALALGKSGKLYYWGDLSYEMAEALDGLGKVKYISDRGLPLVLENGTVVCFSQSGLRMLQGGKGVQIEGLEDASPAGKYSINCGASLIEGTDNNESDGLYVLNKTLTGIDMTGKIIAINLELKGDRYARYSYYLKADTKLTQDGYKYASSFGVYGPLLAVNESGIVIDNYHGKTEVAVAEPGIKYATWIEVTNNGGSSSDGRCVLYLAADGRMKICGEEKSTAKISEMRAWLAGLRDVVSFVVLPDNIVALDKSCRVHYILAPKSIKESNIKGRKEVICGGLIDCPARTPEYHKYAFDPEKERFYEDIRTANQEKIPDEFRA